MAAPTDVAATVLLLPERRRLAGQTLSPPVATLLGRADALADGEPGERAQLLRRFDLLPRGWPAAAITRSRDGDDAALHTWLRADPTWVRADMTGARVMAIGELGLSRGEADALAGALRVLFGDAGMPISAPDPARWYLALPAAAKPPAFALPEQVLGDDLFAHLPEGADGRRWRALLNEAQILLHNHPVNVARVAAGRPPANSLCFWGGGRLPDHVRSPFAAVETGEALLASLAALAAPGSGGRLVDLRGERDVGRIEARLRQALADGGVELDFADGARLLLHRRQRWRFWRRPRTTLA